VSPAKILNEPSAIYFEAKDARAVAKFGPDPEGEAAWEAATGLLKKLAMLIEGPFVLGEEVSYADFVMMGFLRHAWRAGGADVLERILRTDESGKLRGVYEGVEGKGLLERSD
jgi:glutathione S-transferase